MCFYHFKELNKNFVLVFIQGRFLIEVLRCKPEFSFHLVTLGKLCIWNSNNIWAKSSSHYMRWRRPMRGKHGEMIEWHFYLLVWLFRQGPPCFEAAREPQPPTMDWKCQTPGKKNLEEKNEWAWNRFEESMWPHTDVVSEIGREFCVLHKFCLGRRLFQLWTLRVEGDSEIVWI